MNGNDRSRDTVASKLFPQVSLVTHGVSAPTYRPPAAVTPGRHRRTRPTHPLALAASPLVLLLLAGLVTVVLALTTGTTYRPRRLRHHTSTSEPETT